MRKITQSLFTLLLALLAVGSVSAQTVITSLDQLSDSKVYTLAVGRAALDASPSLPTPPLTLQAKRSSSPFTSMTKAVISFTM